MGTHSLIRIVDDGTCIANIYQQYDGYPSAVGLTLAQYLSKGKFVNGLVGEKRLVFNGMGCFAAAFLKHIKDGPGGVYLTSPADKDEEYVYEVLGGLGKPVTVS